MTKTSVLVLMFLAAFCACSDQAPPQHQYVASSYCQMSLRVKGDSPSFHRVISDQEANCSSALERPELFAPCLDLIGRACFIELTSPKCLETYSPRADFNFHAALHKELEKVVCPKSCNGLCLVAVKF